MAIRNIVKDGDPILKKVCRPVTEFNEKLATLLDDMGDTMMAAHGLGLAGPQVGIMRRVCVVLDQYIDEDGNEVDEIIELVNPEIVERQGGVTIFEGCLSFPGRNGAITRPQFVTAKAQDRDGNMFVIEAEDILARAICHELDHLDGHLYVELVQGGLKEVTYEEEE